MTRRLLTWTLRGLAVLLLIAAALAIWKREEITRLMAVNSLFAADRIVDNFSHMDRLFLTTPLPRGDGAVSPLPPGLPVDLPPQVAQWITDRSVTALVIVQDGLLRHESYYLGTTPDDRRISWSVAKSLLSALTGLLLADGTIPSLDIPVTQAAPQLAGSGYDGVTLHQVLQMTSGVQFNEDYLDFYSDINRMGRVLALGGSMNGFAASLAPGAAPPGERMRYVSIDTHVIGMVIEGLTGRPIAELMAERIIAPMGLEAAPYYLTDGEGTAFVLGGLNMTTRDYARFGAMIAAEGMWHGIRVLPEDWIALSTAPSAPTAPGAPGYGYQWWIPQGYGPSEVLAQGIYGQYIYINRARDIVIAVNSADRGFEEPGVEAANHAMLQAIAQGL
jgi:CubicO group peptidase (beta-lactamase class C family)